MKKPLLSSVVSFGCLLFLLACSQFPDGPNSRNYEDYVKELDQYPTWSPDGQHIAYYHQGNQLSEPMDYPSGLYIVNKDGSGRSLVLAGNHQNPSWSPDGQWLVFSTRGRIQKCKTNGDELTTLTALDYLENPSFYFTDWSRDGKYIIFSKSLAPEGGLYYCTPDFETAGRPFGLVYRTSSQARFSPSSDRFAFCKGDQSFEGGIELFVSDTITSNAVRLTFNDGENRGPAWSWDAKEIVFSVSFRLQIMDIGSTNTRYLTDGRFPSWSTQNEIVFSHVNPEYTKEVLYMINSDGSNRRQITF